MVDKSRIARSRLSSAPSLFSICPANTKGDSAAVDLGMMKYHALLYYLEQLDIDCDQAVVRVLGTCEAQSVVSIVHDACGV